MACTETLENIREEYIIEAVRRFYKAGGTHRELFEELEKIVARYKGEKIKRTVLDRGKGEITEIKGNTACLKLAIDNEQAFLVEKRINRLKNWGLRHPRQGQTFDYSIQTFDTLGNYAAEFFDYTFPYKPREDTKKLNESLRDYLRFQKHMETGGNILDFLFREENPFGIPEESDFLLNL